MDKDEAARLLRLLLARGHESPLEHITFTFAIEGVSRVLSHQLVAIASLLFPEIPA
jgi:thymidylate synthase (FAD)